MKILMVCLGNICRSPLAEGIMAAKIAKRGLDDWEVDSAGTGKWHVNSPPDSRSIKVAREQGVDISRQRARQISTADFEKFDLILAMDESNVDNILEFAAPAKRAALDQKIKIIRNYVIPNQNLEVPDPYYGRMEDFETVYQMLDEACDAVLDSLTS
ncbi:MAG: hypothetical protein RL757_684 [Bacteroidota bacterium]|jgi:protein-tyrosine phosphatase